MLLQAGDDFEQVRGGRIARGAEDPMQRLQMDSGLVSQRGENSGLR